MKTMIKKVVLTGLVLMASTVAMANETAQQPQQQQLSAEQAAVLEICDFSSSGMADIAVLQQGGKTKAEVSAEVDKAAAQLLESSQDKQLAGMIGDFWKSGIDPIFATPILPTDQEKISFVQAVYGQSMQACLAGAEQ